MWTAISCHLHFFAWMLVLFYQLFQSTCYQCELQYLAIFIRLLQCWSYFVGSFNGPAINVNFNSLPSSLVWLNAGPILWPHSFDFLSMWTSVPCHLHLSAWMLVLFYALFPLICYQCELQCPLTFIFLLECWSYSICSFNRPAINVNFNIFRSALVCLNAAPILWTLLIDLLSMLTPISWHLHLFAWIGVLFYGLFQLTSYHCELQYLAIFLCLLECWPYCLASFNWPAININSNILPSSFVCFKTFPILRPLSIDLLSMWTSISCHLHLFPSLLVLV